MSDTHEIPNAACKACGANSSYFAATHALKCDYCGTTEELIPRKPLNNLESVRAQMLAPVSITKEDIISSLHHYMIMGKYTPDDILERYAVLSIDRLYWPAFAFKGQFQANWTASFGYEREETYNVREKNDKGYMEWVTKIRKVTDWRPACGTSRGEFCFVGYAGSKLATSKGFDLVKLIEGCSSNLQPWNASYLTSATCESFVLSSNDTYNLRVEAQVNRDIELTVRNNAQGDYQKDWNWTADTSWNSTSLLLPLCRLTFEYDGKSYEFWVDGTNNRRFLGDQLPEDIDRKIAVYRGFIPTAIYTVGLAIGLYFIGLESTLDAVYYSSWLMLAVGLMFGVSRRHAILNFSKQYRHFKAVMTQQESTILQGGERAMPPSMFKLLNPSYDKIVIPFISLILLLVGLGPMVFNAVSTTDGPASVEMTRTMPSNTTPSENEHTELPNSLSLSSSRKEPLTNPEAFPSEPTHALQIPSSDSIADAQPLIPLLLASRQNDWAQVEQSVASIRASESPLMHGDRRLARSENEAALQLLKKGDFTQANQLLISALSKDQADMEIANNLGFSLLKVGDYVNSIKILSTVIMHNPNRAPAWINLAEAEACSGNKDLSLAALKLSVYFSNNRSQLQDHIQELSQDNDTPILWRQVIQEGLREIDIIPASSPSVAVHASITSAGTSPLNNARPIYPPDMEENNIEGRVILTCDVETTGMTSNCSVQSVQGGQSFAQAALDYVHKARYRPAMKNGMPVKELHKEYVIRFRLED